LADFVEDVTKTFGLLFTRTMDTVLRFSQKDGV